MDLGGAKYSRRESLIGLSAIAALTPVSPLFSQSTRRALNFLVVGDWGRGGLFRQRDVAQQMGAEAARASSRFIATTGDNFYTFGVFDRFDPQWKTSFENVYTHEALQIPWYATLGNHDYYGNPDAQIAYAKHNSRWVMNERYYTIKGSDFGYGDIDLFFVDTQPFDFVWSKKKKSFLWRNVRKGDDELQLVWLRSQLSASTARWKLVFGHHPIFSVGRHGDTPGFSDNLLPLLAQHGVAAYIHGHDHCLQHISRGGIQHVCSGAGSQITSVRAVRDVSFAMSASGFASFTLKSGPIAGAGTLEFEFIDHRGTRLHRAYIPEPAPSLAFVHDRQEYVS